MSVSFGSGRYSLCQAGRPNVLYNNGSNISTFSPSSPDTPPNHPHILGKTIKQQFTKQKQFSLPGIHQTKTTRVPSSGNAAPASPHGNKIICKIKMQLAASKETKTFLRGPASPTQMHRVQHADPYGENFPRREKIFQTPEAIIVRQLHPRVTDNQLSHYHNPLCDAPPNYIPAGSNSTWSIAGSYI